MPAAALERLELAKRTALRVRGTLRRRARRETELSALFDTARDLSALHDLDAVLEAIVRRARQLLGTEVAYLTLLDPERGDTYMRVTDGTVSARFRRLRLSMGAGLAGLVAQTAVPYATGDYFADDRFRHGAEIDAAVREEGLIAILGVPLRVASQVIGVLLAADRAARPFTQEEIALLGSLAAHAAIAIENARLLQETRAALDELSTANTLLRSHSEAVERAAVAHDRMTGLVLRGGGFDDVATEVTEVLGGSLLVLDSAHRPLATVGEVGEVGPETFDAARMSRLLGRTVQRDGLLVASVDVGGEPLCTLVLRREGEVPDTDQRILERAALVTALLLLFRRSVAEAEDRVRGELIDDLINRAAENPESLRDRARRLGVDLDTPHVVVAARHTGSRERAAFWASSQAALGRGLAASRPGEVVLLLEGDAPGEAARRVAADLRASLGSEVTAGAAGPVHAPAEVAPAYHEARRCARALESLGRTGHGASAAELGFMGLLIGDGRDVETFLRTTLGPLADYDARRGTALVRTLSAYFDQGGNLGKTAQALHIHVNTVSQRLDRVASLLGADWHHPHRALELHLALRLHHLRTSP
ncbi:GAF domain-containing protein [Bailinhaonella thermotolerans]|uniref:GAF domain-containing protein n=2 Tax=Bailinhaonella thermotolerans TaxID=1070861 RepID=A0A3A4A8A7_9ACTN|nr:GAF domain-containing protein [Bailinhaonella thermotolerans]